MFKNILKCDTPSTTYYIFWLVLRQSKTFHFDLPKNVDNNLANEIYSITKHNEPLAEHTIKYEVRQLLPKHNPLNRHS